MSFFICGGIDEHSRDKLAISVMAGARESIQDWSRVAGIGSCSHKVDLVDMITFRTSFSVVGINAEISAAELELFFQYVVSYVVPHWDAYIDA